VFAALARAAAANRVSLLEGLRDGLGSFGRREFVAPPSWAETERQLLAGADPALRALTQQVGQLFGNPAAAAAQLAALRDPATPTEQRREALRSLARDGHAPALATIFSLLDTPALRRDALRALVEFDDPRVAPETLRRYGTWPATDKAEAILTLAARTDGAQQLLRALQAGTMPKTEISAFAARQLQRVLGPTFVDFWGRVAQPAADKDADLAKYKRLLTDDYVAQGNLARGRAVFERTCAPCHQLYGTGGLIGPDLTGSNRANLDYILGEIINPSDVIQEGYQLVTLTTRDGRTLAGNLAAEDDQRVTLRLIGQDTVVAKAEILSREKANTSMMPEGLLKTLASEEVRDLIAYLRTTQQVPLMPGN
jgi:putative heme-binding domain-containing protein